MGWFKRRKQGVVTPTNEKKETPEGLWYKCPECKTVVSNEEYQDNLNVCAECSYHGKIDSKTYFKILFDKNKYKELNPNMTSGDPLEFSDTKKYTDRIASTQKKSELKDAVRTASGKIEKHF